MAWFLFIDESGHDHGASPYEVLAGVAIRDIDLWGIINEIHAAELCHFGRRYSAGAAELKGKKILKSKVFRQSELNAKVEQSEISTLAKRTLDNGAQAGPRELKALAIAKLNYVHAVFDICSRSKCKIFASVVEIDAQPSSGDGLRKDYGYLFERFFYFLEDNIPREPGIIVFDELEKSQSHLLIDQSHRYFIGTATGRYRAHLIIPEPFFVHSELTTGVQIADLIAYCISWGFRFGKMTKPRREELASYAQKIANLRYRTERNRNGNPRFEIWSVAHITDLRTSMEKEEF